MAFSSSSSSSFCGLIATHVERFHWNELRDNLNIDDSDFNNMFGETFNFDDHLEQALTPATTSLRVNNDHGAVRVSFANDNKISVAVRKRIGAENQSDADKYNSETKPTFTTTGGVLTLDAKTQAAGDHPVQSDLDISIPRKMELAHHFTPRRCFRHGPRRRCGDQHPARRRLRGRH